MSTIKIGSIEGVVVHFGEAEEWEWMMPNRLCRDEPLRVRMIHTWTGDRTKVTCQGCLEWMHA